MWYKKCDFLIKIAKILIWWKLFLLNETKLFANDTRGWVGETAAKISFPFLYLGTWKRVWITIWNDCRLSWFFHLLLCLPLAAILARLHQGRKRLATIRKALFLCHLGAIAKADRITLLTLVRGAAPAVVWSRYLSESLLLQLFLAHLVLSRRHPRATRLLMGREKL